MTRYARHEMIATQSLLFNEMTASRHEMLHRYAHNVKWSYRFMKWLLRNRYMKFVLINMHREKLAVHFMLFITFHSPKVNFIRQIYLTNFIAIENRITYSILQLLQRPLPSYQPWGCYLRRWDPSSLCIRRFGRASEREDFPKSLII